LAASQLDRGSRRVGIRVGNRLHEVPLPARGIELEQAPQGLEPNPQIAVAGQAAHRRERGPVTHGTQERDHVADDVPVGIREPARRLRHDIGAERREEVEDPPAPDANLLVDENMEQAADRPGTEELDQPNRSRTWRRAQ
jgi:hypothetical protein